MEIEPGSPRSLRTPRRSCAKTLLGETCDHRSRQPVDPETGEASRRRRAERGRGRAQRRRRRRAHPRGGAWRAARWRSQVQIDEIFNGFDEATRRNFQVWMKNAASGWTAGLDLNDSMGNIGPFSEDASDVLTTTAAPGGGAARGRAQHWRRLRGPDGGDQGARRGDRRLEPDVPRARVPRRSPRRHLPVLPTFEESRLARPPQSFAADAGRSSAT